MVPELEAEDFVWMRERYNWLCNLIALHHIKTAEEFYLTFNGKFEGWDFGLSADKTICGAFFELKNQEYSIEDKPGESCPSVSPIVSAQNHYCFHGYYDIFKETYLSSVRFYE